MKNWMEYFIVFMPFSSHGKLTIFIIIVRVKKFLINNLFRVSTVKIFVISYLSIQVRDIKISYTRWYQFRQICLNWFWQEKWRSSRLTLDCSSSRWLFESCCIQLLMMAVSRNQSNEQTMNQLVTVRKFTHRRHNVGKSWQEWKNSNYKWMLKT